MSEIKLGSVVRLKSGGPEMTVSGVHSDGRAFCTWFVQGKASGKQEFGGFPLVSLMLLKT